MKTNNAALTVAITAALLCACAVGQETEQAGAGARVLMDEWPNRFAAIEAVELPEPAFTGAFAPDGKTFATCPQDSAEVAFWDASSSRVTKREELDAAPIVGMKYSQNGRFLALRSHDFFHNKREGGVLIWDLKARKIAWRLQRSSGLLPIDFSSDGRYLAAVDDRGAVHLWDFCTGNVARTLTTNDSRVNEVVFSADAARLRTSTDLGEAIFWDVTDGRRVASGNFKHAPGVLWRPGTTGNPLVDFANLARARRAAALLPNREETVSPDGRYALVTFAGPCFGFLLIAPEDPNKAIGIAGDQLHMGQHGFTNDSRFAYVIITEDTTKGLNEHVYSVAFWDAATGKPAGRVQPPGGVWSVAWSVDGKQALIFGEKRAWLWRNVSLPLGME